MGPRPFGRGMADLEALQANDDPLQWGRDLSVAEC